MRREKQIRKQHEELAESLNSLAMTNEDEPLK